MAEKQQVALVTGANTGIGRATALALAKRRMHVVVACRSEEKGRAAVADIRREASSDAVDLLPLDLGSLASVRRGAAAFLARGLPLTLLVNNAGVAGQRGRTADGFELHFGTNHLGHFLLTQLLLDRITTSAPARIVNVASKAHLDAKPIEWTSLQGSTRSFTGLPEYAVSKLANILFTKELARRLAGTGVTVYALHPGVVASDAWRRIPWPIRPLITRNMLSNDDGALTTLHCATSVEAGNETGLYYDHSTVREPLPLANDAALARELWERSERWVA
ncbi:MAG TPA: SDR family oxidoreductase [Candidatus Binatia bacterium]|jgi:NAD(P)-dependent dehydrogenase (short-subunit alcohol dehydrogenase family)|nr:SDR family oxidoreductase [Candidatus Binatia bacterium]